MKLLPLLKIRSKSLKARLKEWELNNQNKDMMLSRIMNQEEEDKFIEDAKSEITVVILIYLILILIKLA